MRALRWTLFWFAEIWIPAAGSLSFLVLLQLYVYWRTGHWIPLKESGALFLGMWLPFVVFFSRGIVLKLQIWNRMRLMSSDGRTLEEARSRLSALKKGKAWRVPTTNGESSEPPGSSADPPA